MPFKKVGIMTSGVTDGDTEHVPDGNSVFDALALKINTSEKGATNGVATLDENKLVPTTQLPSYIDGISEFATLSVFPVTGETGKIYVDVATNKTYRWSGSTYIYITSGAVDSVAGKTGVVSLAKADVGLGNVDNTADVNKPVATITVNGIMSSTDKVKLDSFSGNYTHPTGDGNLHVPVTGTSNIGKALVAGASAGSFSWQSLAPGGVTSITGTAPIVSSGGTTPAISIPVATNAANGYASSSHITSIEASATHCAAVTGAEHGAVSTNTGNMIVRRDASGNFTAGTITAALTGSCSGSSSSCTGNAATSSSCTGNAATSSSCTGNAATCTTATNLSGGTVAATTITATGNITAYYSDSRLKDFHGTIPDALAKVLSLNGYYFTENEVAKSLGCNNDQMQVGVSAQEVENVLPEVVTASPIVNDQNYRTVWYDKLIPLLIEAIKEQQTQIEELKMR